MRACCRPARSFVGIWRAEQARLKALCHHLHHSSGGGHGADVGCWPVYLSITTHVSV